MCHRPCALGAWVQVWAQLEKGEWLPVSCNRHQIGHLDFGHQRLLTEGLLVRLQAGEPSSFFFVRMIYGRFFRPPISLEAEHSDNSLYDFWLESRRHKKKPFAFMTMLSGLASLFLSYPVERRKQTPVVRKSQYACEVS
jgi:hypothetical protein